MSNPHTANAQQQGTSKSGPKGGTTPQVPPDFKIYIYAGDTSGTRHVELIAKGKAGSYHGIEYAAQTEYFYSGSTVPTGTLKIKGAGFSGDPAPTLGSPKFTHFPRSGNTWPSGTYSGAGTGYTTQFFSFPDPVYTGETLYVVLDWSDATSTLAKFTWIKAATSGPDELWPGQSPTFDTTLTTLSGAPTSPPTGKSFYHITASV